MRQRPLLLALATLALAAPAPAQQPAAPDTSAAPDSRAAPTAGKLPPPKAVLGVLDKRLRQSKFFTLTPGEQFRFGRIAGILRTCQTTEPYVHPRQSAAFVEIAEQPPRTGREQQQPPKRIFSGWLFAESPSLNPLQDAVYDVWLKSCTMQFPDGPAPASDASGTSNSGTSSSGARPAG